MMTNYPSSKSTSAKNASSSLSARKVTDIESWEIQRFIWDNHAPFYKGHVPTLLFSMTLAGLFYNKKRGSAFPSMKHLAEKTGWSLRQVSRHVDIMLKAKDENGQPLWEVRSGFNIGGNSKNNEYIPLFRKRILEGKPAKVAEDLPFLMVEADRAAEEDAFPEDDQDVDYAADASGVAESPWDQTYNDNDDDNVSVEAEHHEDDADDESEPEMSPALPSHLAQSEADMWKLVQKARSERKTSYAIPPAFKTGQFLALDGDIRNFLAALTQYCAGFTSLGQSEMNMVAEWIVASWMEHHQDGTESFYKTFMFEFRQNIHNRIGLAYT
jgi:hypothetical protein